jgi:uncharacterized protein (TIGR02145 family)
VTIGGLEEPKAGAILDLNSTVRGGLALSNVTILDLELIPQGTNVFEGVDNRDVNLELRGAMVYNNGQGTTVPAGIYIWNGNCWTKNGGIVAVTAPSISIEGIVTNTYSIIADASVTFAVISPQADVNYAWYKADSPSTPAGTGNTYTTPVLSVGTYNYYCTATSNSCPSSNTTSNLLTITVDIPYSLPIGSGTLAGRACFDVAQTNDGSSYGWLSVRRLTGLPVPVLRADFTQAETRTQTYIFTPSGGGVSNLRFHAVEATTYSGQIIDSLYYTRALETQTNIMGTQDLTIVYKDLNGTAAGKGLSDALKVDIYAVYNDKPDGSGIVRTVKLTASIRDCACCGAFVDNGQWLNFMCHNLGTNETYNPFTPKDSIHGAKYQFGQSSPVLTQEQDQKNSSNVSGWNSNITGNENWLTDNDPCRPLGWRLPTIAEWINVISNNKLDYPGTWSTSSTDYINFSVGLKIGDALFLPASGYRHYQYGMLRYRGYYGYYWSSNADSSGYYMGFGNSGAGADYTGHNAGRSYGFSVRCVAE